MLQNQARDPAIASTVLPCACVVLAELWRKFGLLHRINDPALPPQDTYLCLASYKAA